jgi:exonuclease SbcD
LRLLHAADVHLAPGVPERMEAFRSVCQMVEDLDCSALLICGDLFDSTAAAQDLRVEVRELFDSLGKDVFLIPGNHDLQAFQSGEYYGRDVHICKYPVRWELEGVPLLGIPYLPGRQGIEALCSLVHGEESPFIALMHTDFYNSSLSACFFAEEKDDQGSACLWDRDLEQFPPSYIALGHWHNPTRPPIKINNTQVAYSGTPYPTAKGENGARIVFLIEVSVEGICVEGAEIPGVPRREAVSFFFVPGEEEKILEEIGTFLESEADSQVILDLEAEGWVEGISEEDCAAEIELMVRKNRARWRAVNTGTPQITGMERLSGVALRCLQFLGELEPPDPLALEDCSDPSLYELAREVREDRHGLYRKALSLLLQQMGRGR